MATFIQVNCGGCTAGPCDCSFYEFESGSGRTTFTTSYSAALAAGHTLNIVFENEGGATARAVVTADASTVYDSGCIIGIASANFAISSTVTTIGLTVTVCGAAPDEMIWGVEIQCA